MIWSKTPWVAVAPTHNAQDLERTHNATVALQEITMTQKHPHRQRNVVPHYSPQTSIWERLALMYKMGSGGALVCSQAHA